MEKQFSVAGINFCKGIDDLRPAGLLTIKPEPDNKFDPLALAVWAGEHKVGFVPGPKSRNKEIQKVVQGLIDGGEAFQCEVVDYQYRDGEAWNSQHKGKFGSIKAMISNGSDGNIREHDGKCYGRISGFLDCYHPEGIEFLMRWGINKFKNFGMYKSWMGKKADEGTAMHTALECYFRDGERGADLPSNLSVLEEGFDIRPISFEERMYDDVTGLSGQYDMYGKIDGQATVVDWKSSKKVYPHHKLQACWYSYNKARELDIAVGAMVVAFGGKPDIWVGTYDQVVMGYNIITYIVQCQENIKQLRGTR